MRPINVPSYIPGPFLTAFLVSSLEDAILKALKTHFPHHVETANGARGEFFSKFKREADVHDKEFLEKYRGDLDITLTFVGFLPVLVKLKLTSGE